MIQYYRDNLKCEKTELEVHLIGGADSYQEGDIFLVGQKNVAMVTHLLKSNGIRTYKEDTGGNVSRTVTIKCTNGHVHVKRQKMIL
jgi:chemotaxis protein CheD